MREHRTLVLYKRHTTDCPVNSMKIPASAKRFYMDCRCPIWVVGRTGDAEVPRHSLGTSDLKEAERRRAALIAHANQSAQVTAERGLTIAECVKRYLASRSHELNELTLKHYRLHLSRLEKYCASQNVHFMNELTVDLLEQFKIDGLPSIKDTTKVTAVAKIRHFLRTAFRRGWISEHLAEKVTPHRAVHEQKDPYTDEEVSKILEEAERYDPRQRGHWAGHPHTFRLLLELMLDTGMRVSDATRFEPSLLTKGEHMDWRYTFTPVKKRKIETPKLVTVYLDDSLKRAIDECEWLSPNRPFYVKGTRQASDEVHYRMKKVGKMCGVSDCRPHRLRDTFAVRALLAGVPLEDVSRLLGHSSIQVTERYYAKWVAARQRRLEATLAQARMNSRNNAFGNGQSPAKP